MFPSKLKTLPKQPPKLQKRRPSHPTQHFNILGGQFKRCRLKPDISRRVAENKPEIDMDEVSVPVEEDVAVVSVFDLK
jgi:hypothetical protein